MTETSVSATYLMNIVVFDAVRSSVEEQAVHDGQVHEVHHVGNLGEGLEDSPREKSGWRFN